MTLHAIVVGDAQPFRDALVTLLLDLEDKLEVVGWAQDQEEAVHLTSLACADVALVSAQTEPLGGIRATEEILDANPACRVIVFGERADANEVERAWSAGAAGYVTLDAFSLDLLALAVSAEEARLNARASFSAVALP
jgi:DNA-binding NarL/FixJ family response regulator